MSEIDSMDMLGFLHVRAWKVSRDKKKHEPKAGYIDEIWPQLKP